MSRENVDLVRSIVAPWEEGDFSSTEWAHPEIEYVIADGPAPGRWSGLAGRADRWRDLLSAWNEWRSEHEEFRALDKERVLALWQFSARGKASGLEANEIRTRGAAVFTVHEDKVIRLVHYFDRDRALAGLGLAPPS